MYPWIINADLIIKRFSDFPVSGFWVSSTCLHLLFTCFYLWFISWRNCRKCKFNISCIYFRIITERLLWNFYHFFTLVRIIILACFKQNKKQKNLKILGLCPLPLKHFQTPDTILHTLGISASQKKWCANIFLALSPANICLTSINSVRKIMQQIEITSRPPTRNRKRKPFNQFRMNIHQGITCKTGRDLAHFIDVFSKVFCSSFSWFLLFLHVLYCICIFDIIQLCKPECQLLCLPKFL